MGFRGFDGKYHFCRSSAGFPVLGARVAPWVSSDFLCKVGPDDEFAFRFGVSGDQGTPPLLALPDSLAVSVLWVCACRATGPRDWPRQGAAGRWPLQKASTLGNIRFSCAVSKVADLVSPSRLFISTCRAFPRPIDRAAAGPQGQAARCRCPAGLRAGHHRRRSRRWRGAGFPLRALSRPR